MAGSGLCTCESKGENQATATVFPGIFGGLQEGLQGHCHGAFSLAFSFSMIETSSILPFLFLIIHYHNLKQGKNYN